MKVMEIIQAAYDRIKDRKHWAQGYYQYDEQGERCGWREGHSHCALGALQFAIAYLDPRDAKEAWARQHEAQCLLQRISEELYGGVCIQLVNDNPNIDMAHQEVLHVYKTVLERFKDREPTEADWEKPWLPK